MNQHHTIDLAKSYRARDIAAADEQRRHVATDTTATARDQATVVGDRRPGGFATVRRLILRGA